MFALAAKDLGSLLEDVSRVLIKIDAEGAEAMILKGLSEVIKRFRPTLIIEVVGTFDAEIRRVIPSGYQLHNITDDGLKSVQTLTSNPFRDWVLIPDAV
ncbi:MAG TPA: FkbM family methyltransferase [Pyrinomonadaceae bacterium]|nr:FkbM family methyltransferase [Pyrinomonadaceae bacterium]